MTGEELIDAVVADYLASDLPPEPAGRLAALHDLVRGRWDALPDAQRVEVAAELDLDHTGRLLPDEDMIEPEELDAYDEAAVGSVVNVIRARIPELSVPEG
jgi:hypothetical protein